MQPVLIIIAIFSAVILLVKYAAMPAKPRFYIVEKLSDNAVICRMRLLGKRCRTTEAGFGIDCTALKIKPISDAVYKGDDNDWRVLLRNDASLIFDAFLMCKKYAVRCYALGHVGKYPRVYLFCEQLVACTCGNISSELFYRALCAFEEHAPLSESEKDVVDGILLFCLLGILAYKIGVAEERLSLYNCGRKDGNTGKVDLDRISNENYICGIYDVVRVCEKNSINRLFENNNVDISGASISVRKFNARMYGFTAAILKSIAVVQSRIDSAENCKMRCCGNGKARYVRFFNCALPISILLYVALICIFTTAEYVALFAVVSVISYGILRLPILINNPIGVKRDKFPVFDGIFDKSKLRRTDNNISEQLFRETAYFGSEAVRYCNTLIGGRAVVETDNRGFVEISHAYDCAEKYVLDICFSVNNRKQRNRLRICDGVFEKHRTVYHAAVDDVELCAEFIAPIDYDSCCCRFALSNRTQNTVKVDIDAILAPKKITDIDYYAKQISGGAVIYNNSDCAALMFGKSCRRRRLDSKTENCDINVRDNIDAIVGKKTFDILPFSKCVDHIFVVFGNCDIETEQIGDCLRSDGYFEYALNCAAEYCKLDTNIPSPIGAKIPEFKHIRVDRAPYASKELCDFDYAIKNGSIGYLKHGEFAARVVEKSSHKEINTLSCGTIGAVTSVYGISEIFSYNQTLTDIVDIFGEMPHAFIAIGEDSLIWSPTFLPIGKGYMSVVHAFGYTEYSCAYNGTICKLKCFASKNISSVVFDLSIENTLEIQRNIDVMFSVFPSCGGKIECDKDGLVFMCDKNKLYVNVSKSIDDFCAYKEGYFIRGEIDRVNNFRSGGSSCAPTISVKTVIKAYGVENVVFGISEVYDKIDCDLAKYYFGIENVYYNELGGLILKSDDVPLNMFYKQSLYNTVACFNRGLQNSGKDICFLLGAVKYIGDESAGARIIELFSAQNENGTIFENYIDGLYFVYAVMDYVKYCGNDDLLYKRTPFKSKWRHGKYVVNNATIFEHCLRAIDCAIIRLLQSPQNGIEGIYTDRIAIDVLRFFGMKLSSPRNTVYSRALLKVVARYKSGVEFIKQNNSYVFKSSVDALMYARILYFSDECEKAYDILRHFNPIESFLQNSIENYAEMRNPVFCALYYSTVTELLLGIEYQGKRLRFNPHISYNMPYVSFDILRKTRDITIEIDSKQRVGNVRVKSNNIDYAASVIDVLKCDAGKIIVYRDGKI